MRKGRIGHEIELSLVSAFPQSIVGFYIYLLIDLSPPSWPALCRSSTRPWLRHRSSALDLADRCPRGEPGHRASGRTPYLDGYARPGRPSLDGLCPARTPGTRPAGKQTNRHRHKSQLSNSERRLRLDPKADRSSRSRGWIEALRGCGRGWQGRPRSRLAPQARARIASTLAPSRTGARVRAMVGKWRFAR